MSSTFTKAKNPQCSTTKTENNPQQTSITVYDSSSAHQRSLSMRNFLKFNDSSSSKQSFHTSECSDGFGQNKEETNANNHNNNKVLKRNGFIQQASQKQYSMSSSNQTNQSQSSPLIGRNYPHHRISKSSSMESSSNNNTGSTPDYPSVINLHPVNHYHSKQNSFDQQTSLSPNLNASNRHSFRSSGSNLMREQQNYVNIQQYQHWQQFPVEQCSASCSTSTTTNTTNISNSKMSSKMSSSSNLLATSNSQLETTKNNTYDNVSSIRCEQESPKFDRQIFLRNSTTVSTAYGQILQQKSNSSKSINSDSSSSLKQTNKRSPEVDRNGQEDENQDIEDEDKLKSQSYSFQWIEFMEPKSRTKMFANLSTGECRWLEPKGVSILRQSNPNLTQWWELYDQKTQRFYYYSVKDSKTIWQKPTTPDAIVVPLAKLQNSKHNNFNSTGQQQLSFDRLISPSSSTSAGGGSGRGGESSSSSGQGITSPSSPLLSNSANNPGEQSSSSCSRCLQLSNKIMIDSSTQTFSSPLELLRAPRPSMISRWTQTTTQTPLDIRRLPDLLSDSSRKSQQLQQPSLRHYLLSEARFAARGQVMGQNSDRIYNLITSESIYDPVAQERSNYENCHGEDEDEIVMMNDEDFYEYYDEFEDNDDYEDESDEDFDSCDADDEFGGNENSYSDDDDDVEDEDEDSDELDSDSDSQLMEGSHEDDYDDYSNVNNLNQSHRDQLRNKLRQCSEPTSNNHLYAEYDTVDYDDYIRMASNHQTSSLITSGNKQQQSSSKISIPIQALQQHSNLDGQLRMSASFTASDFKRNALGRSSYTPSLHNNHHYPHAAQHQQQSTSKTQELTANNLMYLVNNNNQMKDAYSNPFNNIGSLRSSTGRINATGGNGVVASIADRIQLFNQKSNSSLSSVNKISSTSNRLQQPCSPKIVDSNDSHLPRSSLLRSSTESDAPGQIQRFSQRELQQQKSSSSKLTNNIPQQVQNQNHYNQQQPSKSTPLTVISPQSEANHLVKQQQPDNSKVSPPNNLLKRSSLAGKFPTTTSNNSFDLGIEMTRNGSKSLSSPLQPPISPSQLYHQFSTSTSTATSGQSLHSKPFQLQLNDTHMVMLNKSTIAASAIDNSSNTEDSKSKELPKKKNSDAKQTIKELSTNKKQLNKMGSKSNKENKPSTASNNNSIESFARECVSRHRKGGIFSKKKTLKSMLIHTKKLLKKPMISTISDGLLVKESVACFKMIQIFMGDRCASPTPTSTTTSNNLHASNNPNERISPIPKDDEQLLVRLINVCVTLVPLRDEVLVQVARQVTQNPSPESERRGLELMCTLFWYFTASNKLAQHLHAFLLAHRNPFTAVVRRKFEQQMNRSRYTHSHLFYRKPHSVEEVTRVLRCVRSEHVGIFGETLQDAIVVSPSKISTSPEENNKNLPWPVVLLTEALLEPRHEDREGVFRCVGDMDDVHKLKMKLDTILPSDRYFEEMIGRSGNSQTMVKKLTDDHDIHVIASTLKLYFRELRESIIPTEMYLEALDCAHDVQRACSLLDKLGELNRSTLIYLIRFLQIFSNNEHVRDTKMDDANLSMVWAPNILRSPLATGQQTTTGGGGPAAAKAVIMNSANIYEHTRAEMSLVRMLIQHLETTPRTLKNQMTKET